MAKAARKPKGVPAAIAGIEVSPRLAPFEAPPIREGAAPLDKLYVAPENARADSPLENIDELAANIIACGLLQSLLAYEDDEGRFAIVGGRRRLNALKLIRDAARVAPDAPAFKVDFDAIPLRITTQANATAASIAENTQRVDLGVVDAALAWNRMAVIEGRDISEIAKAFGVTERFVKSRMKLASLHEPILEALRAGELSLDVAQLYATAHMSRQEKVWKGLGKQRDVEWRVRDELKKDTLVAGDAVARFVGEEAYLAAGGQIEQEFFKAPEQSRWLDPALAERLAQEKLAAEAAKLEAEGFLFVDAAITMPYGKYADGNLGTPRKPTPEEKARVKELDAKLKALRAEYEAIERGCEKRDTAEEVGEYTDEEAERMTEIEDEEIDLRNAREAIEDSFYEFDDKAKQKSGVAVTLNSDGTLAITRGVISPKSRPATPAGRAAKKGKAASAKPAKPEPQAPMTNLTHEKTSRIASAIVGRALAQRPDIALIAVTAALAREVFDIDLNDSACEALTIRGAGQGMTGAEFADEDALLGADAQAAARKRWLVALGKPIDKLEARMTTWPQADVLALLAFCVGESVKVIEPTAARDYKDDQRDALMLLGRLAGANPAAHFIPDADYLEGYSKASLEAAAAELGLDSAGVKTKAALAALVADHAKGGGATAAWVPPLLRTLCGMDEAPKPKLPAPREPKGKPGRLDAGKGAAAKTASSAAKAAAPTASKKGAAKSAKKLAKPPAKKAAKPKSKTAAKGAAQ
ncbi:MAG TPA: ParB N-terminal domain-containing protein [Vitreimonas sp.]|uniref:ParB/RepB/Spo0J family partition protein n=1 Tax=Vitreimonas sp. TaxID=3069702 RepID=UPI002D34F130|nr:ParB N-terminal domain-containing protein [Vitreimonas sp.]HYD87145.1 ParB N-terminal domain-containing protein [Vitreimonas sp.]